jgi:antitoxin HigA-1
MVRIPTRRVPTHPGEMLLEEFLNPMGLTQRELAQAIAVPYQPVNEIENGRRGITPGTALRLAQFFGMSTEFWINGQMRWGLYHARKAEEAELKPIKPYRSSRSAGHWGVRNGVAKGTTSIRRMKMPSVTDVVHSDPEILGGTPVFAGTRVPARTLFEYLESGETLDEFLRQFPSVSRDRALAALEMARDSVLNRARST